MVSPFYEQFWKQWSQNSSWIVC